MSSSVVQKVDSSIHRINHYPGDKYYGNQLHYPLYRDLSAGQRYPLFEQLSPELYYTIKKCMKSSFELGLYVPE